VAQYVYISRQECKHLRALCSTESRTHVHRVDAAEVGHGTRRGIYRINWREEEEDIAQADQADVTP
jgi:hypothetical protein